MKMSVKELNTIIEESKNQMFQWKNDAILGRKRNDNNQELNEALDEILNGNARWWFNPVIYVLQPMTGNKLNDRPVLSNCGNTINNCWVLVFNTNKGVILR